MSSSDLQKQSSNGSDRLGSLSSRAKQHGDLMFSMAKAIDGLRDEVACLTEDQAIVNGKLDEILALLRGKECSRPIPH
jgi:hypothetical protein